MIEIEYTRLIAAAVAAVLLGYALYVAAYVKHKNEKRDTSNKLALMAKSGDGEFDPSPMMKIDIEKTKTWYNGYRLALLGLIVTSAAVGWVAAWAVGQDHVLSWVEDAFVAFAGSLIGGLVMDKYIIHPIADGSFFEKVEDPIVQRFLQDGTVADPVKKKLFRKKEVKSSEPEEKKVELSEHVSSGNPVVDAMTFEEKIKLLEDIKKSL